MALSLAKFILLKWMTLNSISLWNIQMSKWKVAAEITTATNGTNIIIINRNRFDEDKGQLLRDDDEGASKKKQGMTQSNTYVSQNIRRSTISLIAFYYDYRFTRYYRLHKNHEQIMSTLILFPRKCQRKSIWILPPEWCNDAVYTIYILSLPLISIAQFTA